MAPTNTRTWTLSQREGFSQVVETGPECENFNKYSLEASIGTIMCMLSLKKKLGWEAKLFLITTFAMHSINCQKYTISAKVTGAILDWHVRLLVTL